MWMYSRYDEMYIWITKNKHCKQCRANNQYKGVGDLSHSQFSEIKRGAQSRKLNFDVSIEELWDLFVKQNKCCALSGIKISYDPNT